MSTTMVLSSKEIIKRLCLDSSSDHVLHVKRLSDNATLPKRGSEHAAGYDLYR